ncbi:MAG: hypothetical protein ABGW88_02200 [Leeuwenhoekiella sp.]|jgi:uncharacterized protein (TIGR02646 family)|uniref:hypothetical protein n=1 Tax=Leeuwenhoekiella sp. TaxID=1977054 RepID=UPI0032424EC9|tara:strand:+ start:5339 stop:6022 length:684 start_codon:yes stop_codon:yes gene_type:complete
MADLNKVLDYTLDGKTYLVNVEEKTLLDENITYLNTDWEKNQFYKLKQNIRVHYGRRQNRKCAYCRMTINPDGYGNAIEHIMPRLLKPQWMFVQHNLSVACIGCNSSKGSKNTMLKHENNYGHSASHCPNVTNEFKIFNPHFDKWSDHFEIQDEFFLVPKPNSKGPDTYKFCNMQRYQIVLDYIDELGKRKNSYKSITKRLRKEKRKNVKLQLEKAKEALIDMIENS